MSYTTIQSIVVNLLCLLELLSSSYHIFYDSTKDEYFVLEKTSSELFDYITAIEETFGEMDKRTKAKFEDVGTFNKKFNECMEIFKNMIKEHNAKD